MADEDDSFIREVNEELRRENARALWGRYGPIVMGAAVALVLGTAAWQGYNYWLDSKAARIGGMMFDALRLADEEQYDEALAKFDEVREQNFGAYPVLAVLRQASLLAKKGDYEQALAKFDEIANDKTAPVNLQNIAAIHAAYILVDRGNEDDVMARVSYLDQDENVPMRIAAREALGLAAWKAQNWTKAKEYFEHISADNDALRTGFELRALQMLELLKDRVP